MIYTTFKQWVKGRFLEIGEPRKQAYSEDELALVEMGWNYGYDAGVQWQKGQTALDIKADNAKELGLDYEPQRTWVGLTDEQISAITKQYALSLAFPYDGPTTPELFARAIEAAHGIRPTDFKEKNNGS